MSHSKTSSTEEPPCSSQCPQGQDLEPPKPIVEKGRGTITQNDFLNLTFPEQLHLRQKKFQPSAMISVVSKEISTAKYERDMLLKAGIQIDHSHEKGGASGVSRDKTATVAAARLEWEKWEKSLPGIPDYVVTREDLMNLWRRYLE